MSWLERTKNFVTFGGVDRKASERIRGSANERAEVAREELDRARSRTNAALVTLGEARTEAYRTTVTEFVELYELLSDVEDSGESTPDKAFQENLERSDLKLLKKDSEYVHGILKGGSAGALGGATLAAGAYGLAGIVGTASTGTAIGTLSGAAATNATLAWLGGGTLSAGGMGVTGGMALLGGVVAVPAVLVGMFFVANAAEKKLNEARDFSEKVGAFEEQVETLVGQLSRICEGAALMTSVITRLDSVVRIQNHKMRCALTELAQKALELQDVVETRIYEDDYSQVTQKFNELMRERSQMADA